MKSRLKEPESLEKLEEMSRADKYILSSLTKKGKEKFLSRAQRDLEGYRRVEEQHGNKILLDYQSDIKNTLAMLIQLKKIYGDPQLPGLINEYEALQQKIMEIANKKATD